MSNEELSKWMLQTAERHGWSAKVADGEGGGVDIDRSVQEARTLQGHFVATEDAGERARIAQGLIQLHRRVENQLQGAPVGEDGLPVLTGRIRWNGSSPLAGTIEDIDPFGQIDAWRAAVSSGPNREDEEERETPRRRRQPDPPADEPETPDQPDFMRTQEFLEQSRRETLEAEGEFRQRYSDTASAEVEAFRRLMRSRVLPPPDRRIDRDVWHVGDISEETSNYVASIRHFVELAITLVAFGDMAQSSPRPVQAGRRRAESLQGPYRELSDHARERLREDQAGIVRELTRAYENESRRILPDVVPPPPNILGL